MSVDISTIMGVSLGIEFVPANEEADIERSCWVIDLLVVRLIIELEPR